MPLHLVTGATGLVGGNLVRVLRARGRGVRILVRKRSRTFHLDDLEGLERVEGDITDPASLVAAFEGVEDVYHCAAMVSMWPAMAGEMWRVNVEGTENVIEAARRAGARRLVHCSSVDAIGLPEDGVTPSGEGQAWNWDRLGLDNPYARTKYVSQQRVQEAAGKDLDAVIVNPTFMFGAYDPRPSSGQMILEVASGKAVAYPGGGNNFVDVEDVVEAMIVAAERGRRGELYILGGANLSYRQILTVIAGVLGVTPPRFALPYPIARLGGWIGDLRGRLTRREPQINSFTVRMGYVGHYYDPRKAIEELGMRRTPIGEAIERAVRWFREVGMLGR